MKKKTRNLMNMINILLFSALIFSLIVPSERKSTLYSNIDISEYGNAEKIPKVSAVTDKTNLELKFALNNKKLYGIGLYFCVEGEDDSGEITCTLRNEGETIVTDCFTVKELTIYSKSSSIKSKEIILDKPMLISGECTVLLEGDGICPQTRISLYGNTNTESHLKVVDNWNSDFYTPLYKIETLEEKHPYVWTMAFLFFLSLLFSYIVYINQKEK